jgi:pimeloyl-ACP methyl ester carboxylesterase
MMQLEMVTREPSGSGKRVPLLLLHGAWHAASVWKDSAGRFGERGYTVHAVSLPGHGLSPGLRARMNCHSLGDYVSALGEAVDRISPPPVVVAHSMGGAIVQKYLEKQSLPAAVLLAPIPTWGLVPTMTRLLLHHPWITLKALGLRPYEFVRDPQIARRLMIGDSNPMDFESIHAELGDESYLVFLQLMSPFHLRSRRIGSPVLVVAGGRDRLFSPWEHRQTRRRIPGSDWHFEPEDAHELMCEPGFPRVVAAIDDWLRSKGLA